MSEMRIMVSFGTAPWEQSADSVLASCTSSSYNNTVRMTNIYANDLIYLHFIHLVEPNRYSEFTTILTITSKCGWSGNQYKWYEKGKQQRHSVTRLLWSYQSRSRACHKSSSVGNVHQRPIAASKSKALLCSMCLTVYNFMHIDKGGYHWQRKQ